MLLFDHVSALAVALPAPLGELSNDWLYYAICGILFIIAGVICGYFIWRKGLMQTLDAEMEIEKTKQDLENLRASVEKEERELEVDREPAEQQS